MHALPGLGGDHRMFTGAWHSLPGFVAHDWPLWHGATTLKETAAEVCAQYNIVDGDTLIGASLGGMVACEIASIRKLKQVYLIGSAISPVEINPLLLGIQPLGSHSLLAASQKISALLPLDVARMYHNSDTTFMQHMLCAIANWPGVEATALPITRIHGRYDMTISRPNGVDHWLHGTHLIPMTHADHCVAIIQKGC